MTMQGGIQSKSAQSNAFQREGNAQNSESRPTPCPASPAPSRGLFELPANLLAFVQGQSVRKACLALRISPNTVCMLRKGQMPPNPQRILIAWNRYQSKQSNRGPSIKAIRRVHAGGVVHYRGRQYTHPQLAALAGTVPLCRAPEGQLQAVLIGEVTTYLPLQPVED